jgi:Uma2 family endonuclease
MATDLAVETTPWPTTAAELVERLGGIPLSRIVLSAPIGKATEKDVINALEAPHKRLCELVDGVLVEKALGAAESHLAGRILQHINNYLDHNDLGLAFGADGPFRFSEFIRIPDVSFVPWEHLLSREMPKEPIPGAVPALAVEVLSAGNTKAEMDRKVSEYFSAGVAMVWLVQPRTQSAEVYTSPTKTQKIGKDQSLEGGDVLPGFSLPLKQLFVRRKPRRGGK